MEIYWHYSAKQWHTLIFALRKAQKKQQQLCITPPQLCWGQKIFARDITYVARDENMAVKMSDATHERFYDVEIAALPSPSD